MSLKQPEVGETDLLLTFLDSPILGDPLFLISHPEGALSSFSMCTIVASVDAC